MKWVTKNIERQFKQISTDTPQGFWRCLTGHIFINVKLGILDVTQLLNNWRQVNLMKTQVIWF